MTESLTIGINAFFQHSFFSSGLATCGLSLADALKRVGHKPILVNTAGKQEWYEDCQELKDQYERRNMVEWGEKGYPKLDIFIDIDGFIIPAERYKIAKKVVVFYRKQPFLTEQESSVYPIAQPVRNMRECDAVWTWSEYSQQDVRILELLSSRPVHRVPYTWSPAGSDSYSKTYPSWAESAKAAPEAPWMCHITETNMSMASNCTLPIVAIAYTKTHAKDVLLKQYMIHNAQNVEQQQFFKENVMAHTRRDDLEVCMVGRQRIGDWRLQTKSFILSHIRFLRVKGMLLDAVWNGVPIIHNSPVLLSLGNGLERFYYADNSVKGVKQAIENMDADFKAGQGFFAPGVVQKLRAMILARFDALQHRELWNNVLSSTLTNVAPPPVVAASHKSHLRVGFSDMWQSANCNYNFWTLLLTEAGRQMTPPMTVEGVRITEENALTEAIDLLFFAPFGEVWKRVSDAVPKIHITGENTPAKDGNGVVLNFGFEDTDLAKKRYRFPLWAQYIDWFGADQDRLVNPRTLPIDSLTHPSHKAANKSKFAAFVVSNPTNKVRNEAFQWLSQYKKVDSAGRLFNNIGADIFVENGGGGGGELKKHEFLKSYKYCFAYENNRNNGYVTEKMLAAKAAGCVPLYWGALDVTRDFPAGSFLDCNSFSSPEELISAVQTLDSDDTLWEKYANTAAINVETEHKRLAEVASLILKPLVSEAQFKSLPSVLGASSCQEAAVLGRLRGELPRPVATTTIVPKFQISSEPAKHLAKPNADFKWNDKVLLVTFATERFMESLAKWLHTTSARFNDSVRARIYIGDDVQDSTIRLLQTDFPSVEFLRLPTKTVKAPGFDDLWEPQHFAWKLWIYQQLAQEEALANTLVWYMDAASIIVRWPTDWLQEAAKSGICMLEDAEQKNNQWCHETFCRRLMVTPQELDQQQVVGGIMAFVAGSAPAWKTFTEAWIFGQQRDIIVGPKWSGLRADGKPFGHRHDQSILSILRLRNKVPVKPLATVYNHESLRRCNKAGAALYIHRGQFKEHEEFAPRIGEVHLINLARRKDRIQRFKENHESWTKMVCLRPAYDGRRLNLTPALAKLFAPNDFLWKKAIMGCAISHLSLWLELAAESPACENYLILEDDVKFQKGWLKVWEEASKHIPEDYDVLYLGGVLPPNKQVFNQVLEPVNPFWNRVKPNQIFGQREPTTYFHFCNYAYILSRRGAQKVLEEIARRGGYYTSADHMICNRVADMKHYVLNPIVAGCYQDDDPKYQTSEFNNFNRVDGFDSDLWNNDERFTEAEIRECISRDADKPFPLNQVITDAYPASLAEQVAVNPPPENPVAEKQQHVTGRFFTVGDHAINPKALLEYSWLREIFGAEFETIQQLPQTTEPVKNAVYIYMKPHYMNYLHLFEKHEALGIPFYVLHLSDEHGNDPIHFYRYNSCKKIARMYQRSDMKTDKIIYIPLGPYRRSGVDEHTLKGRNLVWNFYGTSWRGREALLEEWKKITPNSYNFYESWMDSKQLSSEEYTKMCLNTLFMPCPAGQNVETFRLYEALDHGCIPIYVRQPGDDDYFAFLNKNLPIVGFQSWEHPIGFIKNLFQNNTVFLQYYTEMQDGWKRWRESLTFEVQRQLNL